MPDNPSAKSDPVSDDFIQDQHGLSPSVDSL